MKKHVLASIVLLFALCTFAQDVVIYPRTEIVITAGPEEMIHDRTIAIFARDDITHKEYESYMQPDGNYRGLVKQYDAHDNLLNEEDLEGEPARILFQELLSIYMIHETAKTDNYKPPGG